MARVGSGKVLKSGPKDKVFVYFADHGAPGLIAFPSSEVSFLSAGLLRSLYFVVFLLCFFFSSLLCNFLLI